MIYVKFELGQEVKDVITGFKGVATGRAQYITGCDQYLVQPTCKKDGKYPDSAWLDDGKLESTSKTLKIKPEDVAGNVPGCDTTAPIK